MAFCPNCGAQTNEGASFCPSCGRQIGGNQQQQESARQTDQQQGYQQPQNDQQAYQQQGYQQQGYQQQNYAYTANPEAGYADPEDIARNKGMAVLAYLGLLVLIPIFAAKDSRYARFHCNQGLVLLICGIVIGAAAFILGLIPYVGIVLAVVLNLCNVAVFVFEILGIINAATGKMRELPLIGRFVILK